MKKVLVFAAALLVTACTTTQERTLEYCDTETQSFIGIPFRRDANCLGLSNSEAGSAISIPQLEAEPHE